MVFLVIRFETYVFSLMEGPLKNNFVEGQPSLIFFK